MTSYVTNDVMANIRVPGYRIVSELGRGGMATVYLAIQESLHRQVALKVVSPTMVAQPEFTQRFLKEGQILARLHHPNIITIFDLRSYQEDSQTIHYLSMEYLPCGTLEQQMKRGLPLLRTLSILKNLSRALHYAHQQGVIHRDIKPPNVLFREDGSPVLTDFGIAKLINSQTRLTRTGVAFGSVQYMSPEQIRGRPVDPRADLYALGVVFFEMLTGHLPYEADDPLALAWLHNTAPIPLLEGELARFQPIINKLLAKEPDDRFVNALQFSRVLEQMEAALGQEPATPFQAASDEGDETLIVPPHRRRHTQPVLRPPSPPSSTPAGVTPDFSHPVSEDQHDVVASHADQPTPAMPSAAQSAHAQASSVLSQYPDKALIPIKRPVTFARIWVWVGLLMTVGLYGLWTFLPRDLSPDRPQVPDDPAARVPVLTEAEKKPQGEPSLTQPPAVTSPSAPDAVPDVAFLTAQTRQRMQQGQWAESLEWVEKALQIAPDSPELQQLRDEIERALTPDPHQQQITHWLDLAQKALHAGHITQPPENNAHYYYQQILALDPHHAQAQAGIQHIVNHYQQQAQMFFDQKEWVKSLTYAEQGLRIAPTHEGLQNLRQQAYQVLQKEAEERLKRIQEQQRQRIDGLLRRARQQIAAGNRLTPPGNNAYESYQAILQFAPDQPEAIAGLELLATYYRELAIAAQQQGDFEQSLAHLEKALSILPQQTELMTLQETVRQARVTQQQEAQQARERQARLAREAEQERQQQREAAAKARAEQETAAKARAEQKARESTPSTLPPPEEPRRTRLYGTF